MKLHLLKIASKNFTAIMKVVHSLFVRSKEYVIGFRMRF